MNYSKYSKCAVLVLFSFLAAATSNAGETLETNYHITLARLWDVTGVYQTIQDGSLLTITLAQDAKGQVVGTRHELYDDGPATHMEGTAGVKGRVSGSKAGTKFIGSAKGNVAGKVDGRSVVGVGTTTFSAVIVPGSLQMQVSGKSKVCVQKSCLTVPQAMLLDLPEGMTGEWDMKLALTTEGKTVEGTAIITLSNNRTFQFAAKGTVNTKTGKYSLRLRGAGDASGASFTTTLEGQQLSIARLSGTLLGQKVSLP